MIAMQSTLFRGEVCKIIPTFQHFVTINLVFSLLNGKSCQNGALIPFNNNVVFCSEEKKNKAQRRIIQPPADLLKKKEEEKTGK